MPGDSQVDLIANRPMEIRASLEPTWSTVRQIRAQVGEQLAHLSSELSLASQMVAAELLENAVKYGEAVPRAPDISFLFSVVGKEVTIVVSNGATARESVRQLIDRIAQLREAPDPGALYLSRLQELMDDPTVRSTGLGLYRIGYEGHFAMACEYQDEVVTVTATRSIS